MEVDAGVRARPRLHVDLEFEIAEVRAAHLPHVEQMRSLAMSNDDTVLHFPGARVLAGPPTGQRAAIEQRNPAVARAIRGSQSQSRGDSNQRQEERAHGRMIPSPAAKLKRGIARRVARSTPAFQPTSVRDGAYFPGGLYFGSDCGASFSGTWSC